VVDGQPAAAVFVHQHERRAGYIAGRHTKRRGHCLHEPRFAGAERADQADHGCRGQIFGDRRA
jgi:hypothetical protein